MLPFEKLGIDSSLSKICTNFLGYKSPTSIQKKAIPVILSGKNIIAVSHTGSGKTAAYMLPILHNLYLDMSSIACIIITVSRELALQITDHIAALTKGNNIKTVCLTGGMDSNISLGSRPNIVVATPGRLAYLMKSSNNILFTENTDNKLLNRIKFLVLDEADRLLTTNMRNDVFYILEALPNNNRQTLLFSATMPSAWIDMFKSNSFSSSRELCIVSSDDDDEKKDISGLNFLIGTVKTLNQSYILIPNLVKECYLYYLLNDEFKFGESSNADEKQETNVENKSLIIFTSKKQTCQFLTELLLELKIDCVALHSDLNQARRLASIGKFKNGQVPILITTDLASRGLDIPAVQLVINYDITRNAVDYLHRVGRTARAGRNGQSISFIIENEIDLFSNIESLINKKIDAFPKPISEDRILKILPNVLSASRTAKLKLEAYAMKANDFRASKIIKRKKPQIKSLNEKKQAVI